MMCAGARFAGLPVEYNSPDRPRGLASRGLESNKRLCAYGREPRKDTRAFVDMITTALVKTNKFNVMERDRLGEIAKEQGLQAFSDGRFPTGVSVDGVDYILLGGQRPVT